MNFPQAQTAKLLDFFAANGVSLFNFAVLEARKSGDGECMTGDKRPRERSEIEKSLGWATRRNVEGWNVYFRPARYLPDGTGAAHPVIFLDDLNADIAAKIAKKYRCVTIETSSNSFHAWIIVNRALGEDERHQVQSRISELLGGGADSGSTSGEHFGRVPGYRNRKPGRKNFWVVVSTVNAGSPTMDVSIHLPVWAQMPSVNCHQPSPKGGPVPSHSVVFSNDSDESVREFKFALARLQVGASPSDIVKKIAARALQRGKRSDRVRCEEYARRTVAAAAGAVR